jgi:hypothetical protein
MYSIKHDSITTYIFEIWMAIYKYPNNNNITQRERLASPIHKPDTIFTIKSE